MSLNRRNLFRAAGALAGAGLIPAGEALAAPQKAAAKAAPAPEAGVRTLKGGVTVGAPLPGFPELELSGTFEPGKSVLNDGVVMNASHWGIGRVHVKGGRIERIEPFEKDLAPSLQLQAVAQQPYNRARIRYPMVRKSYLEKGYKAGGRGRGSEPFVRVSWETAAKLVADELKRVRDTYGPTAIYGGSYGWMSPGAVGNARNLLQRVLNLNGGFTGGLGDYSTGCAQVILPYVIGSNGVYEQVTSWNLITDKTELIVLWGADPTITNDIDWATTVHENADGFRRVKAAKIPVVAVNPLKPDTAEFMDENARWIAPRPGTDVAMMLAMAYELETTGAVDREFIRKYTVGYDAFRPYLTGEKDGTAKTPEWAEKICGVKADEIRALVREMKAKRTMLMGGWGIQRAEHGEQVHWMMVVLAAMLGQIGLPGGGFGFTYHYSNGGAATSEAPALPGISANPKGGSTGLKWEGTSLVSIPLARFTDCFLNPGKTIDHNGTKITYPDIRLVFWSGGNPFAQQEDTNRLLKAWKKPETTIVCDSMWTASARHADIVLPAATSLERNDITAVGSYSNLGYVAMHQAIKPQYESKSDYEIFRLIAREMGFEEAYTEGLDEMGWIKKFYNAARLEASQNGYEMPTFDDFWKAGWVWFPVLADSEHYNYLGDFRKNPIVNPLGTASGKIEIFSEKVASYGYDDCPGHPTWMEPTEWLGGKLAEDYPFALLTSKSRYRLHSQLDSTESHNYADIEDREPCWIHPAAAEKLCVKTGDVVRVESRRGAVLAGVLVTERVRPDTVVVRHGAWYDPEEPGEEGSLDVHGCDNVLTIDIPSSKLANGNVANSSLVRIKKWTKDLPRVRVWEQPETERADD